MYYDEQLEIENSCVKVVESIDELNEVIAKRVKSNEYSEGYKIKINSLRKDLLDIQLRIIELGW